jgi:transposase-like protein
MIDKEKSISELIQELKTYEVNLKIEERVIDYLNCRFVESANRSYPS